MYIRANILEPSFVHDCFSFVFRLPAMHLKQHFYRNLSIRTAQYRTVRKVLERSRNACTQCWNAAGMRTGILVRILTVFQHRLTRKSTQY